MDDDGRRGSGNGEIEPEAEREIGLALERFVIEADLDVFELQVLFFVRHFLFLIQQRWGFRGFR